MRPPRLPVLAAYPETLRQADDAQWRGQFGWWCPTAAFPHQTSLWQLSLGHVRTIYSHGADHSPSKVPSWLFWPRYHDVFILFDFDYIHRWYGWQTLVFPTHSAQGQKFLLSISALIKFVLSTWSCAAVISPSVSFLRSPFRSQSQDDLCLTSSVCLKFGHAELYLSIPLIFQSSSTIWMPLIGASLTLLSPFLFLTAINSISVLVSTK